MLEAPVPQQTLFEDVVIKNREAVMKYDYKVVGLNSWLCISLCLYRTFVMLYI